MSPISVSTKTRIYMRYIGVYQLSRPMLPPSVTQVSNSSWNYVHIYVYIYMACGKVTAKFTSKRDNQLNSFLRSPRSPSSPAFCVRP